MPRHAVVLLSGGLDSTTCLAMARHQGYQCHAMSFDYGQTLRSELKASAFQAQALGAVDHRTVTVNPQDFQGSALTDASRDVPDFDATSDSIPSTYVPARNTIFLAYAMGWAEVLHAEAIMIGVNAVDYSGYPDCRPDYIAAMQRVADLATVRAIQGERVTLTTPLLHLTKAEIVRRGTELGVDYSQTISCYRADSDGRACGTCDSCTYRRRGFEAAGLPDPTRYV